MQSTMAKDDNSLEIQLKQAAAGAASGFITRSLTQPFDVLKIRFQLQSEPLREGSPSKYTSMLQATRLIYKEEGFLAFWKGHNAGQMLTMLYTLFQFWSYEQIDRKLKRYEYLKRNRTGRHFVSGGIAGCVGTVVSMPFDVIRTRVVGQDPNLKSSIVHLIPTIVRQEGVQGLFRGLGLTLVQIGPLIGFNFMFYHKANELMANFTDHPSVRLTLVVHLLSGGFAGFVSKALVYPLDFVKKRIQLQGFQETRKSFGKNQVCVSIVDCIRLTFREEGVMGFYKGIGPTLAKAGATTALYFSLYDVFKALMVPELKSS